MLPPSRNAAQIYLDNSHSARKVSWLFCLVLFFCVQIQKRSGAWFFKGRDQQSLPSPLPLSGPRQSSMEDSSAPGGLEQSQEPTTHHQQHGSSLYCCKFLDGTSIDFDQTQWKYVKILIQPTRWNVSQIFWTYRIWADRKYLGRDGQILNNYHIQAHQLDVLLPV